jgi:biopolymer transport protein ExbD
MVNVTSRISFAVLLQIALIGCGSAGPSGLADDPLQLHLTANDDGSLKQMTFNEQTLGFNDGSFEKLATEVKQLVTGDGEAEGADLQIEISADPRLRFEFVQRAISVYVEQVDTKTENSDFYICHMRLLNTATGPTPAVPRSFSIVVPPSVEVVTDDIELPDIKVKLVANTDGSLKSLLLGRRDLGSDEQAFERLHHQISRIIGKPGNRLTQDIEVEIDADGALRYQHVIQAIKACNGRLGRNGWVFYIERIKFAEIGGSRGQEESLQELEVLNFLETGPKKEDRPMLLPPPIDPPQ